MNDSKKTVLGVALSLVIALVAIAPGSHAGPTTQGRFRLAFDAQLGDRTLPTGDYTFSFDHSAGSYGTIYLYRGTQAVGMVLPQMLNSNEGQGEKPVLVGIRHDGKVTVRALRLPQVGTLYFPLPKDLKTLVAQKPALIQTVSIQVSGE
jgi:hypothetical protein